MSFTADVYKLCCNDVNVKEIYVGSSRSWARRKFEHKSRCNNENSKSHNLYVYQYIRDNGGFSNWSMISLYNGQFENKRELERKEREYIEELKSSLNKAIPTRTKQEYYEEHKEQINEYKKQWYGDNKTNQQEQQKVRYEKNKEKIIEKNKEYIKANKELVSIRKKQWYESNIEAISEKSKQKYQSNKEHIKNKSKQNYILNKEVILEQMSRPYTCECGSTIRIGEKTRHLKTKKHQTYLNSITLQHHPS